MRLALLHRSILWFAVGFSATFPPYRAKAPRELGANRNLQHTRLPITWRGPVEPGEPGTLPDMIRRMTVSRILDGDSLGERNSAIGRETCASAYYSSVLFLF